MGQIDRDAWKETREGRDRGRKEGSMGGWMGDRQINGRMDKWRDGQTD